MLNDFGLARRERTTSSGTGVRYTVSIDAQPLVHNFDAKLLGKGPADAIVEHLSARIAAITATAAPATILKRKYAVAALDRGTRSATDRYSGGRTGTKRPTGSDRLFNDSGRLSQGLASTPTRDNDYVINVPANRFDPRTFANGEAGLVRMLERLRELVPEFGDATRLAQVPSVRAAVGASLDYLLVSQLGRSYGGSTDLRARVREARADAIRQALQLVGSLGG